jgi:hypothetical protein
VFHIVVAPLTLLQSEESSKTSIFKVGLWDAKVRLASDMAHSVFGVRARHLWQVGDGLAVHITDFV